MILVLAACAAPEPDFVAPPPAAALAPVAPRVRTLTGLASPDGLALPTLPGAQDHVGARCEVLNQRLGGNGPPCGIEHWEDRWFLRAGSKAAMTDGLDGEPHPARGSWTRLGTVLSACLLYDPLAIPPAGDPRAQRRMEGDRWTLTFSGVNLCGLDGRLTLDITVDDADWDALTVDGKPWVQGGREAALQRISARRTRSGGPSPQDP